MDMSQRNKGLPVAIIVLFLIQLLSPVVQFPTPELDSKQASEASEIGFSTGSGHDLEGDLINVDSKNWTVRGESILDYWMHEVLDADFNGSFDMVVTDIGYGLTWDAHTLFTGLYITRTFHRTRNISFLVDFFVTFLFTGISTLRLIGCCLSSGNRTQKE